MAFALAKYSTLSGDAIRKILKRGGLLYLVGLLLTAFPFYPADIDPNLSFGQTWLLWLADLRLLGVLPRIAMCYVLSSILVLWLKDARKIVGAIVVLSLIHAGCLLAFAGPEGAFSLEGNFARKVDLAIFGAKHMYDIDGVPFDPEGLWGVLTGSCTVMLGYLAGLLIRKSPTGITSKLLCFALVSLVLGQGLNYVIPINKSLWSVSYVFYTAGWAMFVLSILTYAVDQKGYEKLFFPFKALGMNALALFVLSGLLMKINWRYIGWDYTAIFGADELRSLLFALLYLALHLVIAVIMYRKKLFVKL